MEACTDVLPPHGDQTVFFGVEETIGHAGERVVRIQKLSHLS